MSSPAVWAAHVEQLLHKLHVSSLTSNDPYRTLLRLQWWSVFDLEEKLDAIHSELRKDGFDEYDFKHFSKIMKGASETIFNSLLNVLSRETACNTNSNRCSDLHRFLNYSSNDEDLHGTAHDTKDSSKESHVHNNTQNNCTPSRHPSKTQIHPALAEEDDPLPTPTRTPANARRTQGQLTLASPTTSKSASQTPREGLKGGRWGCYLCDRTFSHRDSVYNHFVVKHKPDGHTWDRLRRKDFGIAARNT